MVNDDGDTDDSHVLCVYESEGSRALDMPVGAGEGHRPDLAPTGVPATSAPSAQSQVHDFGAAALAPSQSAPTAGTGPWGGYTPTMGNPGATGSASALLRLFFPWG